MERMATHRMKKELAKQRTNLGYLANNRIGSRNNGILALLLVTITVLITRAFINCPNNHFSPSNESSESHSLPFLNNGWPNKGFGDHLSLRIYVYSENEISDLKYLMYGRESNISAESCSRGQWGTQVIIHQMLLKSKFRTLNKEDADLYFVPSYVKCVRMKGGLTDREINSTYVKILSKMPYFGLSGGRDHVFVFPSGAGAHLFRSWDKFLKRSIILTPEGHRMDMRNTSAFNTWKDIIIPGNINGSVTSYGAGLVEPLPLSKRKFLANFFGRVLGKAGRAKIVKLSKRFPKKLESRDMKFAGSPKVSHQQYLLHLRDAKFCLVPRGESSWTLRLFESFFVECVPVILSDQVELPFQDFLDYSKISIKWPSTHIDYELLHYLDSISDEEIDAMIAHGKQIRCLFVYAPETESCSAFIGILWELQRKVRRFHQSAETFWLHNGSIINRNLVQFDKWRRIVFA